MDNKAKNISISYDIIDRHKVAGITKLSIFKLVSIELIILLICVYLHHFYGNNNPLIGYKVLYVATDSMENTFYAGDFIVCKIITNETEISVGDIVTYLSSNRSYTVTHRIIAITGNNKYVLKGDHNKYADEEPVLREFLLYKYMYTIHLINIRKWF